MRRLLTTLIAIVLIPVEVAGASASSDAHVRLYTLDCGGALVKDAGLMSDTGEYDGQPVHSANPCFLIRHPKGTLLWDTGWDDRLAPDGRDFGSMKAEMRVTLLGQLKALNLSPADVTHLAFSHLHVDHTGNANAFTAATWILNKAELAAAWSDPPPFGTSPTPISAYQNVKTRMIDKDYDVFGDGSVRILAAPGHTPGMQVLQVRLRKSGVVLLTGDLFQRRENREHRRVSTVNVSRADTLASIDRIERIAANTHARVMIQHDPRDFESLPAFPGFLD